MMTTNIAPLLLPSNLPALKSSLRKNIHKTAVKKSVHFDKQLEHIQHFYSSPSFDKEDTEEKGNVVEFDDDDEDEDDEENKLEDEFLELFWNNGFNMPRKKQHGSISLLNWPSTHPARRFISQIVSLESIVWDNKRFVAQGRVLVHNISYEKKVTIRYTLDDWATYNKIEASYKESAFNNSTNNNSALDRFEFYLPLPESTTCSLAVCYNTNGQEFWDNNNQRNFSIQLTTTESHERSCYYQNQALYGNIYSLHELYISSLTKKTVKPTFHHHSHNPLLIKSSSPPYVSI